MAFPVEQKLAVRVASGASFDLRAADVLFRIEGLKNYRKFQREHESVVLDPGVAYSLVKRLLRINSREGGINKPPLFVRRLVWPSNVSIALFPS